MRRKIYKDLLEWKHSGNKPLVVLGARQVGKSYIIEQFCKNEFSHYKIVNLLASPEIVNIYSSDQSSDYKYKQLKLLLNFDPETEDSILFVDEIQESEEFISDLKYLNENYPAIKLIVAGSLLGIQLKRSKKPFPVGKIDFLHLYPMDFEEFLMAMDRDNLIDYINGVLNNNELASDQIHEMLIKYYREYLICGGMPENVQNYIDNDSDITKVNKSILGNINLAYINDMNRYVKSAEESIRIRKLYQTIPSQLANNSHKFQYSRIEKKARSVLYESSLNWLESSSLINISSSVNKPIKPIKGYIEDSVFKVYLSDIGLLNRMLNIDINDILMDRLSMYKGIIAENFVAQQFISNNIPLYYWRSENTAEIDFIIETDNGVIPVEVKSSENTKSKSLQTYIQKYNPEFSIKLSTMNFVLDNKNIKNIPIYCACFLDRYLK